MSSAIHRLDPLLANQIAAGEVVERPASALKELVENALDAGSTRIEVRVRGGGLEALSVLDTGAGLDADDLKLAFERHATSKIATFDDLMAIHTLGFRGEALPSIASVARVTILSRKSGTGLGIEGRIEGGEWRYVRESSAREGTLITVEDLFYNVPARRKFLARPDTELRHVITTFQRIAICFPNVAFRLISNERTLVDLSPSPRLERVRAIYGDRANDLLSVEHDFGLLSLEAYFSKPGVGLPRAGTDIYVNSRYVVNRAISGGVLEAYRDRLERGHYPFVQLFLEIDPRHVDVNVSPAKTEVRFRDEGSVREAVRGRLAATLSGAASVSDAHLVSMDSGEHHVHLASPPTAFGRPNAPVAPTMGRPASTPNSATTTRAQTASAMPTPTHSLPVSAAPVMRRHEAPTAVWQAHNLFIFAETRDGVLIIDQHAAHERLLFNQALRNLRGERPVSQSLLFAEHVDVSPLEAAHYTEFEPELTRMGFASSLLTPRSVLVEAVPATLATFWSTDFFRALLESVEPSDDAERRVISVAKMYSCKAAIKGGSLLSQLEAEALVTRILAEDDGPHDIHGRSAYIRLSIDQLKREFGR